MTFFSMAIEAASQPLFKPEPGDEGVQQGGASDLISMDRFWADCRYTTEFFEDMKDGCAGLKLHRSKEGVIEHVATVTYWDAAGQFFIETHRTDIPVEIANEMIAETTETVRFK